MAQDTGPDGYYGEEEMDDEELDLSFLDEKEDDDNPDKDKTSSNV